eukprot:SAG31_NODE_502_length_14826_cov_5.474299_5_plen_292_part_00
MVSFPRAFPDPLSAPSESISNVVVLTHLQSRVTHQDPETCINDFQQGDFVVWTNQGHDHVQIRGTLAQCKQRCCDSDLCVGFSRAKPEGEREHQMDTESGNCWLKKFLPEERFRTSADPTYQTYYLPGKTGFEAFAKTRQSRATSRGFTTFVEHAEGERTIGFRNESVGWLATTVAVGHIGGHTYIAGLINHAHDGGFDLPFTIGFFHGPPRIFGNLQHYGSSTEPASLRLKTDPPPTSVAVSILIEEDKCADDEGVHEETEGLAYIALSGGGQQMLRARACASDISLDSC